MKKIVTTKKRSFWTLRFDDGLDLVNNQYLHVYPNRAEARRVARQFDVRPKPVRVIVTDLTS